ncbi:unnamed protein product [Larinioides sclopetarius]|uniref:Sulfotransferase domain-containing protein n=1 Tax=Larinioides sclopetarius TaxID=280406 RepID=A0AAV2BXY6_9ARAC
MSASSEEKTHKFKKPTYKEIDGFRIPTAFSEEAYKSALAYKPRPDDLFIVTYPKCGTTWVQNLAALIFRDGKPFTSGLEFFTQAPFLELTGAEGAEKMKRPGSIKIHLPFQKAPYSPEAKYIFIARNPKDCCVSHYHHTKNGLAHVFADDTFEDFLESFIKGEVDFGDYFETTLSWWEHRNDPNVLFITYEELKKDTINTTLKIAGFIGSEYKEKLEKDPKRLQDVIQQSSFDFMNEYMKKHMNEMLTLPKEQIRNNPDIPSGLKALLLWVPDDILKHSETPILLVRKGIIGDWRNYFSPSLSARMDEKMKEKFAGTGLLDLWKGEI